MRLIWTCIILLAIVLAVSGCGAGDGASDDAGLTEAEDGEEDDGTAKADNEAGLDTEDMFTDRDLRNTYEEDGADTIELTGSSATCSSTKVSIVEDTVFILDEGVYIISGTLDDGMIIIEADDSDKIQLVLDGVEITNADSAAIYVKKADKVFITTAEGSVNTLRVTGEYDEIDDNNIDGVIFSKDDLTLNGLGTLIIEADYGHGVVSKDDLVVTGGSIEITSADHGLQGKDSVRIGGGNITIDCAEDGIHSENDDDDELGFVYIEDGTIEITAGDDGIHAGYAVLITGGSITVLDSYEGIEGLSVEITDGDIDIYASDDGINAAGGNDGSGFGAWGNDIFSSSDDSFIIISGGYIHINASGDGIDSNGDLTINGGEIYISGPTGNADGILDFSGTCLVNGGTLAAFGSSGMLESISGSSAQTVITVTSVSGSAGSLVTLTDSEGTVLLSWEPDKSFSAVILSCAELEAGETYTLSVDGVETEVTAGSTGGSGGNSGGNKNSFGGRGGTSNR